MLTPEYLDQTAGFSDCAVPAGGNGYSERYGAAYSVGRGNDLDGRISACAG